MDADLVVDQVIPAGGSVDVPLTFEGSSFGSIQVFSLVASVTASFGGTALSGSATDFTSISTSMSNPSDGALHVVNAATTEATVTVIANVQTTRHVTVTPSADYVAKGGSLSFDVQVSEATAADGASAYLQDPAGAKTPITLTKVGPGHWTGQASPSVSGANQIHVQTSGDRVRYDECLISVSTGNVTFGSGFSERLVDTDHDGLANQLELTPTVTALKPGTYSVTAHLVDASGTEVSTGGGAISLTAGAQPLPIDFDGTSIYNSGLSGPFRLVKVTLDDEGADPSFTDASATDLGATQAYDYHTFQHFPVLIDRSSPAITPVDADGNGYYEGLSLTGHVTVDSAGSYLVSAGLFTQDGTEVGETFQTSELAAGTNSLSLTFDGPTIWKSGKDGPYTIQDLSVSLASDSSVRDTVGSALTTAAYTAHQFTPPPSSQVASAPLAQGYYAFQSTYSAKSIYVPFTADFPGGTGSVELWEHYSADGSTYTDWTKVATATASPFTGVALNQGNGFYGFYTLAVDGVTGEKESPPASADATTQLTAAPVSYVDDAALRASYGSLTSNRTLSVPVISSFPSGSGHFELWEEYGVGDPGHIVATSSTSPVSVTLGADGSYDFFAIGVDSSGAREPWDWEAGSSITLDTTAPSSTLGSLPATSNAAPLQMAFTSSDDTRTADLFFRYRALPTDAWGSWTDYGSSSPGKPFQFFFPGGPGYYVFYTLATDYAGNVESVPASAEASTQYVPQLTSSVSPLPALVQSSTLTIPYTAGYPSGSGSVELWQRYAAYGQPFSDWANVLTTSAWPITYTTTDGDGRYEFYTIAIDASGAQEGIPSAADASTLIDGTPPDVALTGVPAVVTTAGPVTFTCDFTDEGSGVASTWVEVRYSQSIGSPKTYWSGGKPCTNGTFAYDFPYGDGYYEFGVVAADNAGNSTPDPPSEITVAVQYAAPPDSHILPPASPTNYGCQTLHAVATNTYEIWEHFEPAGASTFDDWALAGYGAPGVQNAPLCFGNGDGRYEFYSIAVDYATGAREAKPETADAWLVLDTTPPLSTAAPSVIRTAVPTITVAFTASDPNGTGVSTVALYSRYRANQNAAWGSWESVASGTASSSPFTVTMSHGEGFYEFATSATDAVGNTAALPSAGAPVHYTTGTDPSSSVRPLPAFTHSNSIPIPYVADFASGGGSIDLYEQFKAKGGSTFTQWSKVATVSAPGSLSASLTSGDGTYAFYTIATDSALGISEAAPTSADASVVLDTVSPTSTIGAIGPTTNQAAGQSVIVTATDDASGISLIQAYVRFKAAGAADFGPSWQLFATDNNAYGSGMVDETYILSSGDGTYQFGSVVTDGAGNVETGPVTKASIILDTGAPTASISPPAPSVKSSSLSVTYTATDNANGSGIGYVDIYERYQAAGSPTWFDWTYIKQATASPTSVSLSNGDGRYEFYVHPFDLAGNCPDYAPVTQAFTVLDQTAPTSQAGPLSSPTSASAIDVPYTANDGYGSGVASVDLYRRFTAPNQSPGPYSKVATVNSAASSGTFSAVALSADGTYDFYTRATDALTNVEAAPSLLVADATIVRSTPPPASKVASSISLFQKASPLVVPWVVTANGGGLASVELWYRYTAPGATPSGSYAKSSNTYTGSNTSGSFNYTASSDGTYEFYTIAVATNGNREAAPPPTTPDASVILDKVVPTSTTNALTSPTRASTVDITYNASDNANGSGLASVELWERFTVPGATPSGNYTLIFTNPGTASPQKFTSVATAADGRYEFYTISVDKAGNRKAIPSSAEATVVRDTTAPTSTLTFSGSATKATTISITYAINDGGGSGPASIQLWQRYTVPGASPSGAYSFVTTTTSTAASGSFSNVALSADGKYEFYSIATDAAGNSETVPGSAKITVIRDQVLPTSSAGPLASLINSTALSVPYTASDVNGSGIAKVDLYQSFEAAGSTTWSTYAKVGSPGTATSGSISITLSSGAGSYRFYTLATDAAGNVEVALTTPDASTVLDTTAPTSSIPAPGLPSTSSAASISVAYTASDNTNGSGLASVECWYRYRASDGTTPGAWTTCGTSATASGSFTLTFGSGAGIYDVLTVAVDKAGNREGAIATPPASGATPKSSVRSISWAPAAKVNTDTGTAVQDNAAYVVGSDGTLYAVWEDGRAGNTDIYFSSRNPATGVWAAEIKLNTDTGTAGQRTPSIAIDGSGNLYVVWADDRNGSTNTDIYFAKRTGTTWSANIKVNSDTATAIQSNPRISVSSAGIAVAVWYDKRSSQTNIYSARLAAGSTTWSTNYNVTTSNTSAVKATPDVAVASDGTAWATWQDNRTGGGDIYVASLGPTATAWSTNTKVSDDSGTSSLDKSPRIGLTSASPNQPVVAYLDGRTSIAQVRVVNHTTSAWNASVQVSDSLAKPATGLALAVKPDGGVIVAWDDTRATTSAIWGAQCEAGSGTSSVNRCGPGEKWSDQTGASYRPTLVASTTTVYLGWRDDTAGNGDIRARLRTPS